MAYLYPYGDTQQLNLDWLIEQWNEVKSQIDGSLQAEIDRVEAAITDLLTARNEAVAAQTAAQASAQAAAGSASTASGAASTATAQAQAAAGSAATAGAHASDAQGYAATAQQAAQAANNSAGATAVSEGNARNSETAAAGSSSAAAGNALYAEGYAKGTQNGNPVSSGSPYYENNAKYYSEQAAQDASDAADSAQDAQDAATLLQPPATSADIGKALIVKTVGGGTVTSYELGESGGGGGGTPGVIQTIEDVQIASFDDGLNSPVQQLIVDIVPAQSGSGDPAPDNIRPITGWTGANVTRTGKSISQFLTNSFTSSSNVNGYANIHNGFKIDRTKKYVYSAYVDNTSASGQSNVAVWFKNANDQFVDGINVSGNKINAGSSGISSVIIDPAQLPNTTYIYCGVQLSISGIVSNFMLEIGDAATEYEPYTGTTYAITFPTETGPVYYGHIDFSRKKLIVDGAIIDLGTLTWLKASGTFTVNRFLTTGIANTVKKPNTSYDYLRTKCSSFKYVIQADSWTTENIYSIITNGNLFVMTNAYETADEFKTAVNGVMLTYQLATSVEYDISDIPEINILAGYNNIWADIGNINLLQYYADSKKYIDDQDAFIKALIAKELLDMTADTALVANDFRIVNNTLYRITTSVASGGTLTPGTNCAATTITDILTSLL